MMESINVVINDTISEKDIDGDGDGDEPNLKKNEGDDNMSQGEDAEKESPDKLHLLYQEGRPNQLKDRLVHSPLLKFNPQSLVMRNLPLLKDHCQG